MKKNRMPSSIAERSVSALLVFAIMMSSFGAPVLAQTDTTDGAEAPTNIPVVDDQKTDDADTTGDGEPQPGDQSADTGSGEPADTTPQDPELTPTPNPDPQDPGPQDPNPTPPSENLAPQETNMFSTLFMELTADTTPPSVPTNGQPHATIQTTNPFTFTWDASTDDSGDPPTYFFQSSLDGTESGGVLTNGLWSSSELTTNSIFSSGAPDGTWYWQVRAKDSSDNYSNWSEIWHVILDVAGVVPSAPTLVSPADGATVPGASVTQSWSSSDSDIHHYVYQSWNDAGMTSLRFTDTYTATSKTATNVADATFWWRVQAVDDDGNESPWSELWELTIDNSPPPPDTTDPTLVFVQPASAGLSFDNSVDVTLDASDTESGLDNVVVHVYDSSDTHLGSCGAGLSGLSGSASESYLCTLDVSGYVEGDYYFKAGSFDMAGNNETITLAFVVDHSGPTAPQIISPTNGQIFGSQPILNDWTESTDPDGIDHYEIEYIYSDGHTFSGGPYRTTAGTVTQRNHTPGISEQGGVTIRVRAYDGNNNVGDWSNSVYYIYDVDGTHQSRIIEPTVSEVTSNTTDLVAYYQDQNGDHNDGVQWAVRAGTCAAGTGTVAGNVDGHSDVATWDHTDFSFALDTTTLANGSYCFVFNPTEDSGNINQRLTREFSIDNVTSPPTPPTPTSQTIVVREPDLADSLVDVAGDITKWFFYNDENDTIDNSLGSFVDGPDTAPAGEGSAQMTVSGTERRNIATYQFQNVELADIEELTFSTYSQSAGNGSPSSERAPYLHFNVDFNDSDVWQYRLVFVPSVNGVVLNDTWQEWDAIDGGTALWTWSRYHGNGNQWPDGDTNQYRTWDDLVASFPDIQTRATDSWFGFRVGEPYADGFTGNVDEFVIRINDGSTDETTTYDFEPTFVTSGGTALFGNVANSHVSGDEEVLGVTTDEGLVLGATCPLITEAMREGSASDASQVSALQTFLNAELGINIPVTGVFDLMTTLAVNVFQLKYQSEVLVPWAAFGHDPMNPTGYVYKSTLWKINDLACPDMDVPFPALP